MIFFRHMPLPPRCSSAPPLPPPQSKAFSHCSLDVQPAQSLLRIVCMRFANLIAQLLSGKLRCRRSRARPRAALTPPAATTTSTTTATALATRFTTPQATASGRPAPATALYVRARARSRRLLTKAAGLRQLAGRRRVARRQQADWLRLRVFGMKSKQDFF